MNSPDIKIVTLVLGNGRSPARDWLLSIRDTPTRARIERQIDKLARGLGVQKGLGGIAELKIDLGPGYRVYYAFLDAQTVVVLLGGGDKSTQTNDIRAARALWEDFEQKGQPETALQLWREAQAAREETGEDVPRR